MLVAIVAANALLIALLGGTLVPSIGLRFSSAPIAAVAIIPILVNSTVQLTREKQDWQLERTAIRKIRLLDVELMAGLGLIALAFGVAAHAAGDRLAIEGARNTAGYLGLGLVVSRVAGPRIAATAPAFYVFLLGLFSTAHNAQHSFWTWPLHAGDSSRALASALALFVSGLAAVAFGLPRIRPPH